MSAWCSEFLLILIILLLCIFCCRSDDGRSHYGLLCFGYNSYKADTSGLTPVNCSSLSLNFDSYAFTQTSECKYEDMYFYSAGSTYSDFSSQYSLSLEASFSTSTGAGEVSVAGKGSVTLSSAKTASTSQELYFYIMDFRCQAYSITAKNFRFITWDKGFLSTLNSLPQIFNDSIANDIIGDYTYFWNGYGTHFMQQAKLGGSIFGSVSASKCGVEETFESTTAYEACLSGEYTGTVTSTEASVEICSDGEEDYTTSITASSQLSQISIELSGGDMSTFADIIEDFKNGDEKEIYFGEWIKRLNTTPTVMGATLYPWSYVITQSIGYDHNFNQYGEQFSNLNDEEILEKIGIALENAEEYYDSYLLDSTDTVSDDCSFDCGSGTLSTDSCSCSSCDGLSCCTTDTDTDTVYNQTESSNNSHFFVIKCTYILLIVLLCNI